MLIGILLKCFISCWAIKVRDTQHHNTSRELVCASLTGSFKTWCISQFCVLSVARSLVAIIVMCCVKQGWIKWRRSWKQAGWKGRRGLCSQTSPKGSSQLQQPPEKNLLLSVQVSLSFSLSVVLWWNQLYITVLISWDALRCWSCISEVPWKLILMIMF